MGNALVPCFKQNSDAPVKLVFWGGNRRFLAEKQLAGELMFEFPDRIVCDADSFYIGQPIPTLSIDDELLRGKTYFVLPVDLFPCQTLTAATLTLLSPGPKGSPINFGQCTFDYVKGRDGRNLIKVSPQFVERVISEECRKSDGDAGGGSLCSTPELRKHYTQLVGSRERPWSPKLETISEFKARNRMSPARLLGLEWR